MTEETGTAVLKEREECALVAEGVAEEGGWGTTVETDPARRTVCLEIAARIRSRAIQRAADPSAHHGDLIGHSVFDLIGSRA